MVKYIGVDIEVLILELVQLIKKKTLHLNIKNQLLKML